MRTVAMVVVMMMAGCMAPEEDIAVEYDEMMEQERALQDTETSPDIYEWKVDPADVQACPAPGQPCSPYLNNCCGGLSCIPRPINYTAYLCCTGYTYNPATKRYDCTTT